MNVGVEIDQIRSQIEQIGSVLVNWGSKYKNSKPETKIKEGPAQPIMGYIFTL